MSTAARNRLQHSVLAEEHVVFTGRLASMTRGEALRLVELQGGRAAHRVSRDTTLLVLGQDRWPLAADGRMTRNLRRAQSLQQSGRPLQILSEDAFLGKLGLHELREETCRRYSLAQLGSLLGLSRDRLRAWMRAGLIQPVETIEGVPFFDFGQVAAAKTLYKLSRGGVSTVRLRRSLEQLQRWLPQAEQSLAQLHLLSGRLLVRHEAGFAELNGQMLLDFDPEIAEPPQLAVPQDADSAFIEARRLEDLGRYAEAVQLYQQWLLQHGPDAAVIFNLANALAAQGREEAAIERFRQAVEVHPDYVEAWNNLGAALASRGEQQAALDAFQVALAIQPDYADALYNLADTLDELGRPDDARPYWEKYLTADPDSPWAEHARCRLEDERS